MADSGLALVSQGRASEGFARLDAALAAISAGEVGPVAAGICVLLDADGVRSRRRRAPRRGVDGHHRRRAQRPRRPAPRAAHPLPRRLRLGAVRRRAVAGGRGADDRGARPGRPPELRPPGADRRPPRRPAHRAGSDRGGGRSARPVRGSASPAARRWRGSTCAAATSTSPRPSCGAACRELVGDVLRGGSAAGVARRRRAAARRHRRRPGSRRRARRARGRRRRRACCAPTRPSPTAVCSWRSGDRPPRSSRSSAPPATSPAGRASAASSGWCASSSPRSSPRPATRPVPSSTPGPRSPCFERLGATIARDRAAALLRGLGDTGRTRPQQAGELTAALTAREREVLRAGQRRADQRRDRRAAVHLRRRPPSTTSAASSPSSACAAGPRRRRWRCGCAAPRPTADNRGRE